MAWLENHQRRFGHFIDGSGNRANSGLRVTTGESQATGGSKPGAVQPTLTKPSKPPARHLMVGVPRQARPSPVSLSAGSTGPEARRLFAVSNRWTTASPSANRATSTFRWSHDTSPTTLVGRRLMATELPTTPLGVVGQIIP